MNLIAIEGVNAVDNVIQPKFNGSLPAKLSFDEIAVMAIMFSSTLLSQNGVDMPQYMILDMVSEDIKTRFNEILHRLRSKHLIDLYSENGEKKSRLTKYGLFTILAYVNSGSGVVMQFATTSLQALHEARNAKQEPEEQSATASDPNQLDLPLG